MPTNKQTVNTKTLRDMSIPFGSFGMSFKEAIVTLESLKDTVFEDQEKEKIRLSFITYIEQKMNSQYPLQAHEYFNDNPTPSKRLQDEIDKG